MTKFLLRQGANPHLDVLSYSDVSRSLGVAYPAIGEARTVEEAEMLYEKGANPKVRCGDKRQTHSLIDNVIMNLKDGEAAAELIDLHLDKGADPNEVGFGGYTPLHGLANHWRYYNPESMKRIGSALINYGVDIDAKTDPGDTAKDILIKRRKKYVECSSGREDYCRKQRAGIDALLEVIREAKEKQSKG